MKKLLPVISIFILSVLTALLCGSTLYTPAELLQGLLNVPGMETAKAVLIYVRLPRLFGGIVAGAGLANAGVLLQSVTNNPLAGPSIIGVNAGAGLGTVLLISFLPGLYYLLPAAAFAGAVFALMCVLIIAGAAGGGRHTVIVAGIALTSFFQAGISLVSAFDTDVYAVYSAFALGSLGMLKMQSLYIPSACVMAAWIASVLLAFRFEALRLGDDRANTLGINARLMRLTALCLAALSAASAVSFAGLLGFVGLIVPHIAEAAVGPLIRRKLLAAPLIGAAAVLIADTIGRTLFAPSEIAAGVITAAVGAPAFVILLLAGRRKQHD